MFQTVYKLKAETLMQQLTSTNLTNNLMDINSLISAQQKRIDLRSNYITRLEAEYAKEQGSNNTCKMTLFPSSVALTVKYEREQQAIDKKMLASLHDMRRISSGYTVGEVKKARRKLNPRKAQA